MIDSKKNLDFPTVGIPQILYFGEHEEDEDKIMIMEMLGVNLDKMFTDADLNFSIEKIRWIAKQLVSDGQHVFCISLGKRMLLTCFLFLHQIDRIETIHKAGWVYIDIKPENFAIGKHDTWLIYMFGKIFCSEIERDEKFTLNRIHSDFGLCQKFLDENGKHIVPGLPARYGPGTIEFMSIRAHKTQILSRRDDIEGIGYLILYFLQGTLPWSDDLHHSSHEVTSNFVHQKKIDFKIEVRIYKKFTR